MLSFLLVKRKGILKSEGPAAAQLLGTCRLLPACMPQPPPARRLQIFVNLICWYSCIPDGLLEQCRELLRAGGASDGGCAVGGHTSTIKPADAGRPRIVVAPTRWRVCFAVGMIGMIALCRILLAAP